jgi:hypothetical protein
MLKEGKISQEKKPGMTCHMYANCRRIGGERDWRNMVDILLSLSGEYI